MGDDEEKQEVTVTVETPAPEPTPAPAPAPAAPAGVSDQTLAQLMDLQQRLTETEQRLEKARMDMVEQFQLEWMRESIKELRQEVERIGAAVALLTIEELEEEIEEEPAPEAQAEVPVPVVQAALEQAAPERKKRGLLRFLI